MPILKETILKLYRTQAVEKDGTTHYTWQGTQADASKARAAQKEAYGNGITVDTDDIDVPTDKPGLLAWLNANVTGE